MSDLEHKILVALTARKIETAIRELGREHEEKLKSIGVDVREFQLLLLDLIGEAYEVLKTKVQQSEKK